ncbi:MAG: hypothetical protein JNK05_38725 [Myxococcales bacterium]|nr:hypothetical protein [Myxococcales bacterium]
MTTSFFVRGLLFGAALSACAEVQNPTPPRDASRESAADATVADVTVADVSMQDVPPQDTSCASFDATASVVRLPLDVIVVVDSSNSFDRPRGAISSTLAPNLISALERAMVDYRVIVVGGAITAPPATMPRRYFYVNRGIGSGGLLGELPGHLRAALPHLRPDALKAVVVFTDDGSGVGNRNAFYTGMNAADLTAAFGTRTMPKYIVHAVAGLAPNMPPTTPWPPPAPVVTMRCSGFSANPAAELQELARETRGYRFPLCSLTSYSSLFDAVAAQAIAGVRLPCEFAYPMLSDGRTPDIFYARGTLTLSSGMTSTLLPVRDESACAMGGFYLVRGGASGDAGAGDAGAAMGDRVRLCPTTCMQVQADERAMVNFRFECPPG